MQLGVIGLGVVGGALLHGFRRAGMTVLGYDVLAERALDPLADVLSRELVLLTVPAPSWPDGRCDLSAIHGVLDTAASLRAEGSIVLKSTVPVGTTDALIAQYPQLRIGYSPEFLRARTADEDFLLPRLIVFGGAHPEPYLQALQQAGVRSRTEPMVMTPGEAEMVKLLLNGFAALKSVFSSEMADLAGTLNVNWSRVVAAATLDGRLGEHYLEAIGPDGHPGFGGACLPKDARMLARQLGPGSLLEAALCSNARLRQSVASDGEDFDDLGDRQR